MPGSKYRVGDLLIDTGRQQVTRGASAIALPKLSYELLIALVRAAPNLLSLNALTQQVWPKAVVSPETVSQRVKLLRDALDDDPRKPRYIEGLRGRGYRLIPSVESDGTPSAETQSPGSAPGTSAGGLGPQASAAAVPQEAPRRLRLRTGHIAVTAAIAVIAVISVLVVSARWHQESRNPRTSVEVVAVQPPAVAVLPFDNLSAELGNDYITLGMADSVLHQLASVPELIVVARSSSFALGRPLPDAREIGRMLGARYLVEGSVQRAGKALRVTARLIDTTSNHELWSLKVDRAVDDVFLVQDEIAQRVAQQLDVALHGLSGSTGSMGRTPISHS